MQLAGSIVTPITVTLVIGAICSFFISIALERSLMNHHDGDTIAALQRELVFFDNGGYRDVPFGVPLIFEDSPTCHRTRCSSCPEDCVLLQFVPIRCRTEVAPCRQIALDALNRTIDDFYRTGTKEELAEAFRSWLIAKIENLQGQTTQVA